MNTKGNETHHGTEDLTTDRTVKDLSNLGRAPDLRVVPLTRTDDPVRPGGHGTDDDDAGRAKGA